jgi:opacity protein-like surface antigen
MRTVSVVGGIAAILISASAMAADLPLQKPLPTPVAARGWTGFYVGLNAGYTWTDNGQVNVLSSFVPGSQNPFFIDSERTQGSNRPLERLEQT